MRRIWSPLAAAAVGCAALAGCSSSNPGGITAAGTKVLAPAVQHLREVAAAGSYASLRSAVHQFESLVRQEEQRGDVTATRGAALLDAADVLLQDAKPSPSPTPSPTSETPTPTPTSESPTPTPTPTSESPTPTPTPSATSASPIASASVGAGAPARRPRSHATRTASPTASGSAAGSASPARS